MGNFKVVFYGTEESKTDENELTLYRNSYNDLFINIKGCQDEFIVLDVITAVRLSRELRRVIAEIKEVQNA